MNNSNSQALVVEGLYALLRGVKGGDVSVFAFCENFERLYNFELDRKSLSEKEKGAFADLFNKVVWFSPYPEEREAVPHYLSEAEILHSIEVTLTSLL